MKHFTTDRRSDVELVATIRAIKVAAVRLLGRRSVFDQFGHLDAQSPCDLEERLQSRVDVPALGLGYVVLIEARQLGELVLRQIALSPECTQPATELHGRDRLSLLSLLLAHSASTR